MVMSSTEDTIGLSTAVPSNGSRMVRTCVKISDILNQHCRCVVAANGPNVGMNCHKWAIYGHLSLILSAEWAIVVVLFLHGTGPTTNITCYGGLRDI